MTLLDRLLKREIPKNEIVNIWEEMDKEDDRAFKKLMDYRPDTFSQLIAAQYQYQPQNKLPPIPPRPRALQWRKPEDRV